MEKVFRIEVLFFCASVWILGLGCGGEATSDAPQSDEEFCEHLTQGPFQSVASSTVAADAPDATYEHTAIQISLSDGSGFVGYQAGEMTDYQIALSEDVPIRISQGNAEVSLEKTERPAEPSCGELKVLHTVELSVGTAVFAFGPSSVGQVDMVVEEAAHGLEHGQE